MEKQIIQTGKNRLVSLEHKVVRVVVHGRQQVFPGIVGRIVFDEGRAGQANETFDATVYAGIGGGRVRTRADGGGGSGRDIDRGDVER